jgi:CubicO group peptidase (beta-lactamase class C family)
MVSARHLAAALAFCFTTSVAAQTPSTSNEFSTRADTYMQASVRFDQFSGTVLVARDGVSIFNRSYGMANYELSVPNSPDTIYRIGSLTKQFTALAIMQLQERGRLNLAHPICNYLDTCPDAWRAITIRHLLTHTSGIPNFSSLPDWDERLAVQPYTPTEFVGLFRDLPLQFEPGADFRYSNSGYMLLGLIVQRASGQSYEAFLRDNIFTPLGMNHTGHHNPRALLPNRANGYDWAANGFVNAEYEYTVTPEANGALYSTAADLLRWDQALYTEQLVSRRALDEIFTSVRNNYGYGWIIGEVHGRQRHGHSGSIGGFSSYIARFPAEHVTVIVLSNSDRTSATKVANDLAAIAFSEPYATPTQQINDLLWTILLEDGAPAAIRQYRRLRRSDPESYDFSEDALNDMGYDLLGAERTRDAILFFALAVQLFPESANAYDSLGEAYMKDGQRDAAIRNYERSLALDPENANAARMLADLRAAR